MWKTANLYGRWEVGGLVGRIRHRGLTTTRLVILAPMMGNVNKSKRPILVCQRIGTPELGSRIEHLLIYKMVQQMAV